MVRVKICCIASIEEAALAVRHGAAAIGLVGPMPSGPGMIDDRHIAEIAASTPPAVATFLLTSEIEPEAIVRSAYTPTGDKLDKAGNVSRCRVGPGNFTPSPSQIRT